MRAIGLLLCIPLSLYAEGRSFEEDYRLLVERAASAPNPFVIERDWARAEGIPDPFPETPHMTLNEIEEAKLRRAYSFYSGAAELAVQMREELKPAQAGSFRDPLWWKELEQAFAENRRQGSVRRRYGIQLAEKYHRVFGTLRDLDRTGFRRDPRVTGLKQHAYRQYIMLQAAVGNHGPALEVLDQYAGLPGAELEWPMHYYYFVCLQSLFRELVRSSAVREETLISVRRRKNLHWLRAVELKFGRDSAQFSEVDRIVKGDENDPPRSPVRPYPSR